MKKLVMKTVLITILVVISLSSIFFGGCAIFMPRVIGKMSVTVGNYSVACWAYKKQFEFDDSDSALDNLNESIIKYCEKLINNGEYERATDVALKEYKDEVSNLTLSVVNLNLWKKKNDVQSESEKEIIENCILLIENSLSK